MNTLVIFDSQFGNTARLARQIASTLSEFGPARAEHVTDVKPNALRGIDLLVIGSPTQGWHSTPNIKAYVQSLNSETLIDLSVAEFDTVLDMPRLLTGSAAKGIAKQMRHLNAVNMLPPESFLVTGREGPLAEGELEHAVQWARQLHERFESQHKLNQVLASHSV